MRFQFEADLPHQLGAIEAVCGLFAGAEGNTSAFTIAPAAIAGQLALAEKTVGYGNRLALLDDEILANLHAVQDQAALPRDAALRSMDFTVEMETGTGKTYVYLRTVFELNKRYGFTKFVIVVPSVAIREGVKKSIEQMRGHFRALYDGEPFTPFVYSGDAAGLAAVRSFAGASSIQIMIVTIQSINSANNVFYDGREQTGDVPAVDLVADTRPILIVDEPQSVDGGLKGAGKKALDAMKPLATLRYSATHVDKHHQVFRLDAFDAHDRGLVKSIEVDGARIEDADSAPFVKLLHVEAKKGQVPRARLEIALQGASSTRRDEVWAYADDRLTDLSKGRTVYDGIWIGEVSKVGGADSVQLMLPGDVVTLRAGDAHGDVDPLAMARAMIATTIKHHLDKERKLRPQGIKVLSLFFLNRVGDYRLYDDAGKAVPGPLATVFEEEYRKAASKADYATLFAGAPLDPAAAHGGYFSADKRSVTPFEDKQFAKSTKEETVEARTFDLIMKDKERLLDEATPLRFLFSHSALREGWDNPNVFQVCVLRAMGGERQRRQSLGRGLRLCVDAGGQRRRDEGLNVLTVVSDETFGAYADGLQAEMERDLGVRLGFVEQDLFAGLVYATPTGTATLSVNDSRAIFVGLRAADMIDKSGNVTDTLRTALVAGTVPLPPGLSEAAAQLVRERLTRLARKLKVTDVAKKRDIQPNLGVLNGHDFQELWSRINTKTTYRVRFDDAVLIATCAQGIVAMPPPGEARVTFETATVLVGREGVTAERTATSVPRRLAAAKLPVPDLLGELQNRTDLPRRVLARILIDSGRVNEAAINPAAFVDACATVINAGKRLVLVEGITYRELPERWAQELFEPEEAVGVDRLVAVAKAPVSHVTVDSNVERVLATDMDQSDAVRVFAKLPKRFTVPTPLGTYNPDWAVAHDTEDGARVYLVSESKGDLLNLRDAEQAQIKCGEAHFEALGVPFVKATRLAEVLGG